MTAKTEVHLFHCDHATEKALAYVDTRARRMPLRAPHCTTSAVSITGRVRSDGDGGLVYDIGELARADGGVLLLDDLPEWSAATLLVIGSALKHGKLRLSTLAGGTIRTLRVPLHVRLVLATAPECPCGVTDHCQCTKGMLWRWRDRLSWAMDVLEGKKADDDDGAAGDRWRLRRKEGQGG